MTLNTDQKKAVITIHGDPDGSGARDAVFEMVAGAEEGLSIAPQYRTGFIVSDRGNLINTVISELVAQDESPSKGFYLDLGTGQYVHEIDFQGWEGAQYNGDDLKWGDDPNPGVTATSATGADPITQMQVFFNWIRKVQVDSRPESGTLGGGGTATFEFGQHSEDGVLEPLDVVFENPGAVHRGSSPSTFDGTITVIEAASLDAIFDAQQTTP